MYDHASKLLKCVLYHAISRVNSVNCCMQIHSINLQKLKSILLDIMFFHMRIEMFKVLKVDLRYSGTLYVLCNICIKKLRKCLWMNVSPILLCQQLKWNSETTEWKLHKWLYLLKPFYSCAEHRPLIIVLHLTLFSALRTSWYQV